MSTPFDKDSASAWKERIIKELKGAPYEKVISQTNDGIEIAPFYVAKDGPSILGNGAASAWRIKQEFLDDSEENNSLIHESLMAGVNSISVDAENLEDDLDEVNLEMIEIEIGGDDFHFSWIQLLSERGLKGNQVRGGYAWDPFGGMLLSGSFQGVAMIPQVLQVIAMQAEELTNWYLIHVAGDNYHNAGATAVQELAFSLSQLNAYLEVGPELAGRIALTLAAGTDYFETASKFRAMRILWANLLKSYGKEDELKLCARSASRDLAPVDQHGNLLRATAQSMAAIAGGAERITIQPFKEEGDAFSYRMARNIQKLLMHESYMDKNLNPMEGAYLFEELTAKMAEAAWIKFKEIEAEGGWTAYCLGNKLQEQVKVSAEKYAVAINSGEQTWLGVNTYPDPSQATWKDIHVVQEDLALPYFENTVA